MLIRVEHYKHCTRMPELTGVLGPRFGLARFTRQVNGSAGRSNLEITRSSLWRRLRHPRGDLGKRCLIRPWEK
jgi:hypothetical protein